MKKTVSLLFKTLTALAFLFLISDAIAQQVAPTPLSHSPYNNKVRCASDEMKANEIAANPAAQLSYSAVEAQIQQYVANHIPNPNATQSASNGLTPIITIPVVVHILYNATAENLSNAQVMTQIARLNLDYRKNNIDTFSAVRTQFRANAGDPQIEFCIAVRDPSGNATTGIIHKPTTVTTFPYPASSTKDPKYSSKGGDDIWDRNKYLNLWVCNMSGSGILGFAQFPGGAAATDGVVISYDCFGDGGTAVAPYDKGRTATHEVGHWLSLYHPFQGGCVGMTSGTCSSQGDLCCDTPPVSAANYGCPGTVNSCAESYSGNRPDMTENYMDYTDDACMAMFSTDQIARMHATVNGSRSSLLASNGCIPLGPPPVANFTASTHAICAGQTVTFTDATTGGAATSFAWNFGTGATPATATTVGPHTVTLNTGGNIVITYTATNANGSSTHKDTIVVTASPTPNITGYATICNNTTTAYTVSGTANTYTWSVTGGTISSGQGTHIANVTWGSAGSGQVIIHETNANSCSRNDTINVAIQNTITPVITGSATACNGVANSYSVPFIAGVSYQWTVTGGTISSGQFTNSINVAWGAAGSGTVAIAETFVTGCVGNNSLPVTINATPLPVITGSSAVCAGGTASFSVTAISGSTYAWSVNGIGSISSGQATATINSTWPNAGNGFIQVIQTANGCAGSSAVHNLTVHASPVPTFTSSNNGLAVSFTNTTAGGISFVWAFGDTQGDNTASPTHTYAAAGNYTVTLTVTDANNCTGTSVPKTITVGPNGIATIDFNSLVKLIPNPTKDVVNIELNLPTSKTVHITITDVAGKTLEEIYNGKTKSATAVIPYSAAHLAAGIYLVRIEGLDNVVVKKLVKE